MSKRLAFLEQLTASGKADSFAWYGLAMEYRSLQRFDDALRTFETLREKDPGYVAQYLMAAQMLSSLDRGDEAREWAQQGLDRAREKRDSHALNELEVFMNELKQGALR
ncbi:MAG: tetratricopeptide repeat protein [Polyangiaceae bacterium]